MTSLDTLECIADHLRKTFDCDIDSPACYPGLNNEYWMYIGLVVRDRLYIPLKIKLDMDTERLTVYHCGFYSGSDHVKDRDHLGACTLGLRELLVAVVGGTREIRQPQSLDAEIGACVKLVIHEWKNTFLKQCLFDGYKLDLCDPNSLLALEEAIVLIGGVRNEPI